jgi:hypothetical protein
VYFSAVEDVITMISKFETISASTADVLAHMQKLTHQSMAFLKLAFPIGSLIAGALHIATNNKVKIKLSLAIIYMHFELYNLFHQKIKTILSSSHIRMNTAPF